MQRACRYKMRCLDPYGITTVWRKDTSTNDDKEVISHMTMHDTGKEDQH